MVNDSFLLKYNVELFAISHMVNRAKSEGLKEICIDSPLFRIGYDELTDIANYLIESKSYKKVEVNFPDRRNAYHPSGTYFTKTLTLEWD